MQKVSQKHCQQDYIVIFSNFKTFFFVLYCFPNFLCIVFISYVFLCFYFLLFSNLKLVDVRFLPNFGQTCTYEMSRDLSTGGRIFAKFISKEKKVTKNYHAISGGRAAAENFVRGVGVNLPPPQWT